MHFSRPQRFLEIVQKTACEWRFVVHNYFTQYTITEDMANSLVIYQYYYIHFIWQQGENMLENGLEVGQYGQGQHPGTSLVSSKPYQHFFS